MTPSMTLSLNMAAIFEYAESIITVMLPVVYVVAGIGLGFVIVNRIISAFR